jgi:hypothetical protein
MYIAAYCLFCFGSSQVIKSPRIVGSPVIIIAEIRQNPHLLMRREVKKPARDQVYEAEQDANYSGGNYRFECFVFG